MEELKKIGSKRSIAAGAPVFTQGAPVDSLFLIKTGRIKLSKVNEDGTEITLDFRKAGDVLGEDIFAGEQTYPLSAWAMEETVTCGFAIRDFNRMILTNPDIGLSVIRSMGLKMGAMTDRLESMSESGLENRLHSVLGQIAREHGSDAPDGVCIDFPLTHEELGFLVGAHRVSVTKAMQLLVSAGKVSRKGKKLTLDRSFF